MNRSHLAVLGAAVVSLASLHDARAQELSPRVVDRSAKALVKIVAIGEGEAGASGSGTIIDPRGYILTAFHVVGRTAPGRGWPGTLINPENRYAIATADGIDGSARFRWVASVVRADTRLDLALLRILGDVSGSGIQNARFSAVPLGAARVLSAEGSPVWTLGYSRGQRTPHMLRNKVERFEKNTLGGFAWIDLLTTTDAGNTGGMVVDASGRLVGVAVGEVSRKGTVGRVGQARPAERIPRQWLDALRKGAINDVNIDGVRTLTLGEAAHDLSTGDAVFEEMHYFRLPTDRPAIVSVSPETLALTLYDARARVVRRGTGTMELWEGDPKQLLVAIQFTNRGQPTAYTLRIDPSGSALSPPVAAAPAAQGPPPRAAPEPRSPRPRPAPSTAQLSQVPGMMAQGPLVMVPTTLGPTNPSPPAPAPEPPRATATVRGQLLDALAGGAVSGGTVIVGRPGLDLGEHLSRYLRGEIAERRFREALVGLARANVHGRYQVTDLPVNRRYPVAAFAPGYRPAFLNVSVDKDASVVELRPIQMTK